MMSRSVVNTTSSGSTRYMQKVEQNSSAELMRRSQSIIAARLRKQAGWCARLGSHHYDFLLEHSATDVEAGAAPAGRCYMATSQTHTTRRWPCVL